MSLGMIIYCRVVVHRQAVVLLQAAGQQIHKWIPVLIGHKHYPLLRMRSLLRHLLVELLRPQRQARRAVH